MRPSQWRSLPLLLSALMLLAGCAAQSHHTNQERQPAYAKATKRPIVYAFTASWCGPCQRHKPRREALKARYDIREIDTDEHPEIARQFGVDSIPDYYLWTGTEWRRTTIEALEQ